MKKLIIFTIMAALLLPLSMTGCTDADVAGIARPLQPCGDVDAVAKYILAFDNDITQIDTDAKGDPPVRRDGIAGRCGPGHYCLV